MHRAREALEAAAGCLHQLIVQTQGVKDKANAKQRGGKLQPPLSDDDGPEGHDTPRAAPLRPPCCPAGLVRGGREEKRERGCLCSTAGKHRFVEMGGSKAKYHCRTGLDTPLLTHMHAHTRRPRHYLA